MRNFFCFGLLMGNLLLTQISAVQISLEDEMKEKINMLSVNSFSFVDLGLTEKEIDLSDQLKIDLLPQASSAQYDRFGDLHLLNNELPVFLNSIGNNDEEVIEVITKIITRTVQNIVSASSRNSAWVCVRAFTPTANFNTPRWHIDGAYYGLNGPFPYPKTVFKFAATLKGSPTLLYQLPDDQRDTFIEHQHDREFLSEYLDIDKAESPRRGEGVFFIVANNRQGAVHSEPSIDSNRLFFSVLIGDKSEIEELYSRWHPKEPSKN